MKSHPVHEQLYLSISIDLLRTGDIAAFHRCYNSFHPALISLASELLNNKVEAVRVVQLVFIKCWIKQSELTSFEYLEAFLRATVRNICKLFNNENNGLGRHLLNRILSAEVRYGQSRKELYKQLQLLSSETNQSVHVLFTNVFSNKKTVAEIAEETNEPVAFVQSRIDLACQQLHLIMSHEGF